MKKIKNVTTNCYVCGATSSEAYLTKVKGEKDKYVCEYCTEDDAYKDNAEDSSAFYGNAHPRNPFFDGDVENDSYLYE